MTTTISPVFTERQEGVPTIAWPEPPPNWDLAEHEVHVWCASLDPTAEIIANLDGILSEDEHGRARRFLRVRDQNRFVAGRGLLRQLLTAYLGCDPAEIGFVYGVSGKPALARPEIALEFNMAHSEGFSVYAISRHYAVGVDIEAIRAIDDMDGIANRFFAAGEVKRLNLLPREVRTEAFFNCWTRKEAFLKGKGNGIGNGLDQFEVSLAPEEPAMLVQSRLDARDLREWALFDLRPVPGYAAALAINARDAELRCWQFAPWGVETR